MVTYNIVFSYFHLTLYYESFKVIYSSLKITLSLYITGAIPQFMSQLSFIQVSITYHYYNYCMMKHFTNVNSAVITPSHIKHCTHLYRYGKDSQNGNCWIDLSTQGSSSQNNSNIFISMFSACECPFTFIYFHFAPHNNPLRNNTGVIIILHLKWRKLEQG